MMLVYLFAQSLISLTLAQGPEVSSNGDISIWYPTSSSGINGSLLNINVVDVLLLSYASTLQHINASMWCLSNETTQVYGGQILNNPRKCIMLRERGKL